MVRRGNSHGSGREAPAYPPELTIPRRTRSRGGREGDDGGGAAPQAQASPGGHPRRNRGEYHASFARRSTVETMGAMSEGNATQGSGVLTVDLVPSDDEDEHDAADADILERGDLHVRLNVPTLPDDAPDDTHHRSRRRARRRDIQDFRTSITSIHTKASHLVQSNDEDPSFWGVSNRWFSDAGEFVGELTGMATRRAAVDVGASFPRAEGVEIVSAVDYDEDEHDDDNDEDEAVSHVFSRLGELTSGEITPFDDLSTLGDTPTGIFTVRTAGYIYRGVWTGMGCFALALLATQIALYGPSLVREWTPRGGISMFTPRRSRRYAKMKARLAEVSGEEAFLNEQSPQHRALVYLADTDALGLDPNDPHASTQLLQRYALAVLYFSTGGSNWKDRTYWLTGRHECGWMFVICTDLSKETANEDRGSDADDDYSSMLDSDLGLGEGKIVTGLSLYGQGLHGTIPREISALEHLHVLDLGNNNLEGFIELRLQHLHKLYLENNRLKGGTEAMAWLSSLKRVNVEGNQLSGTIPYDLGKLKHLEELRMGQNRLQGTIPSSLLRSKSLTKLEMHGNELAGELIIHEASVLKYLYLFDNMLSGELTQSSMCSVSDSLVDLRVNNNSFVGKIPDIDCTMEQLELLSLAQNELTGPMHNTLGERIPKLREIHLYENKLLSTIPDSIFRPQNLTAVLLGNNALTGSLTANMVNGAGNLAHFYVNSNKLSGKLDDFAKASLPSLKKLRLEHNNFSGSIPEMNMIGTIELLYLYNNSLTGTLDNIGGGVNLRKLKVSNNSLDGEITPKLGDLRRLEVLSLNGNNLVGTLPTELQKLKALEELRVEYNVISGAVPQGVCDLRKSVLEKLASDCGGPKPEVSCSCCTECY